MRASQLCLAPYLVRPFTFEDNFKVIHMNTLLKAVLVTVAAASFSTAALAGTPKSFAQIGKGVAEDGTSYKLYRAKCSATKNVVMTKWSRKEWCEGEGLRDNCTKSNLKLGKQLCK